MAGGRSPRRNWIQRTGQKEKPRSQAAPGGAGKGGEFNSFTARANEAGHPVWGGELEGIKEQAAHGARPLGQVSPGMCPSPAAGIPRACVCSSWLGGLRGTPRSAPPGAWLAQVRRRLLLKVRSPLVGVGSAAGVAGGRVGPVSSLLLSFQALPPGSADLTLPLAGWKLCAALQAAIGTRTALPAADRPKAAAETRGPLLPLSRTRWGEPGDSTPTGLSSPYTLPHPTQDRTKPACKQGSRCDHKRGGGARVLKCTRAPEPARLP